MPGKLDRSPRANWVEKRGGLPDYIERIAVHLHDKGMPIGYAIATAINAVKKACATGDLNFPGVQNENAGSRAEACKAVAQWEALKASQPRWGALELSTPAGCTSCAGCTGSRSGGPTPLRLSTGRAPRRERRSWAHPVLVLSWDLDGPAAAGGALALASANGHHIPGTPYDWRHGWIPLNVATALLHGKKAHAEKLRADAGKHDLELRRMSDDDIEQGMQDAIAREDYGHLDRLSAESDRREAAVRAKNAAADAARIRREQEANDKLDEMGRLIEGGMSEADAHVSVYGGSRDDYARKQAVSALRAQGYQGKSFDELSRRSFQDHLDAHYDRAEADTRGVLLSRDAEAHNARQAARRGKLIDPRALFHTNEATARKHASRELRDWWDENGRPTLEKWRAELLDDPQAARRLRARRGVMAAAHTDDAIAMLLDRLELARHVRTEAGVRRYKKPIGSLISGTSRDPLTHLRVHHQGKVAELRRHRDGSVARKENGKWRPATPAEHGLLASAEKRHAAAAKSAVAPKRGADHVKAAATAKATRARRDADSFAAADRPARYKQLGKMGDERVTAMHDEFATRAKQSLPPGADTTTRKAADEHRRTLAVEMTRREGVARKRSAAKAAARADRAAAAKTTRDGDAGQKLRDGAASPELGELGDRVARTNPEKLRTSLQAPSDGTLQALDAEMARRATALGMDGKVSPSHQAVKDELAQRRAIQQGRDAAAKAGPHPALAEARQRIAQGRTGRPATPTNSSTPAAVDPAASAAGRRGGNASAAVRRNVSRGAGEMDDADDRAAREIARGGPRESTYNQDRSEWHREARELGPNPTAAQLAAVEANGWDAGQIVSLNRARAELGMAPVLTHLESVSTRKRAGSDVSIRDEVAGTRSGKARNVLLAELSDKDLDDVERTETAENRMRGRGNGSPMDRRKANAYDKRERIIRDVKAERDRRAAGGATTTPGTAKSAVESPRQQVERENAERADKFVASLEGMAPDRQALVLRNTRDGDLPRVQEAAARSATGSGVHDAVQAEIARRSSPEGQSEAAAKELAGRVEKTTPARLGPVLDGASPETLRALDAELGRRSGGRLTGQRAAVQDRLKAGTATKPGPPAESKRQMVERFSEGVDARARAAADARDAANPGAADRRRLAALEQAAATPGLDGPTRARIQAERDKIAARLGERPRAAAADARKVRGTAEYVAARQDALGRSNRQHEMGLPFDEGDRQNMAEAQIRGKTTAPSLFDEPAADTPSGSSTQGVTGDLSNVQAFTDDQLAAELGDAQRRMQQSRHNRAGLAYTDAKMAVNVLAAEQRRRDNQRTAAGDARAAELKQTTARDRAETQQFRDEITTEMWVARSKPLATRGREALSGALHSRGVVGRRMAVTDLGRDLQARGYATRSGDDLTLTPAGREAAEAIAAGRQIPNTREPQAQRNARVNALHDAARGRLNGEAANTLAEHLGVSRAAAVRRARAMSEDEIGSLPPKARKAAGRLATLDTKEAAALSHRSTSALALAGAWDPAKHPRAPAGQANGGKFAPARNAQAAEAQKDAGAQANYGKTLGAGDAKDQLAGMSPEDLIALSKAAYSFKSSDPKVVALRISIANEIAKRGGNVNDYGGLGKGTPGGPKPLGGPTAAAKKAAATKKTAKKPAAKKPAAKKKPAEPPKKSATGAARVSASEDGSAKYADGTVYDPDTKTYRKPIKAAHVDGDALALAYRYRHGWVLLDGSGNPVTEKKNKTAADLEQLKKLADRMGPQSRAAADYKKALADAKPGAKPGGAKMSTQQHANHLAMLKSAGERRDHASRMSTAELRATDTELINRANKAGKAGLVSVHHKVVKAELTRRTSGGRDVTTGSAMERHAAARTALREQRERAARGTQTYADLDPRVRAARTGAAIKAKADAGRERAAARGELDQAQAALKDFLTRRKSGQIAPDARAMKTQLKLEKAVAAAKRKRDLLNGRKLSHPGGGLALAIGASSSSDGPRTTFNASSRKRMAKAGVAMDDGSFPIPDREHLVKACRAIGRAPAGKRPAVKAHIRKRARALGVPVPA